MEYDELVAAVQALLLIVDNPVSAHDIALALEVPETIALQAIERWQHELEQAHSGIQLRFVEDGWRLYTHPRFASQVERLIMKGARSKLSRAALETLAVVAYRQPVTRSEVARVRGVSVDGVMRMLVARGLIMATSGDDATQAATYSTTHDFLDLLGISDLNQLPQLAPLLPTEQTASELGEEFTKPAVGNYVDVFDGEQL